MRAWIKAKLHDLRDTALGVVFLAVIILGPAALYIGGSYLFGSYLFSSVGLVA